MNRCPDDGKELAGDAAQRVCQRCGGIFIAADELGSWAPEVAQQLLIETDAKSGAFAKTRTCPSCGAPMAPWRIGKMQAWLEKCPSCDHYWVEKQDVRTVRLLAQKGAVKNRINQLSAKERAELTSGLASAMGDLGRMNAEAARLEVASKLPRHSRSYFAADTGDLSLFHAVLAWFGLPVVTRTEGDHPPILTVSLALVLIVIYVVGAVSGASAFSPESMSYIAGEGTVLSAVTSIFAHVDFWHIAGNVYFLLAFGDGVEQKVPRWLMALAFVLFGALGSVLTAAFAEDGTLVLGASGGIAVFMGACIVLQARARVVTRIGPFYVRSVPLWLYGIFEVLYQTVMYLLRVPGVAWLAHLFGLASGVALGFVARKVWGTAPLLRT